MDRPLINRPSSGDVAATFVVGLLVGGIGYWQDFPLVQLAGGGIIVFSMLFVLGPILRGGLYVVKSWRNSPFARRLTLFTLVPTSSYVLALMLRREFLATEGHFLLLMAMLVWMGVLVIWSSAEVLTHLEDAYTRRAVKETPEAKPVVVAQAATAVADRPAPIVIDPDGQSLPDIELDEVWFRDKEWLMDLILRMPND